MTKVKHNPFIDSARFFLQECASRIAEDMSRIDTIQAILNFAIGMERVLKGILYDLNPTYVLVSPEFRHSLRVLYGQRIVDGADNKTILAKTPQADVITFRNSLLRAAAVSESAQKNKNRLFGLSNLRDVLAHHDLALFDVEKAMVLLKRDFYFITIDFADELRNSRKEWFGACENNVIDVARNYQQDSKNILRLKLEEHRSNWEATKQDEEAVRRSEAVTDERLESEHRYETTCPACNQRAVLVAEPDYVFDVDSAERVVAGEFVRLIHCEFCGLNIDDDLDLDELGYGKSFHSEFSDDDIPF